MTGQGADFAAEVAAQRVILQCVLSRLSLVAAAETGDTPRHWLDAMLNQIEAVMDNADSPPAFAAMVRERAAVLISGSIPVFETKTPAKPKPDRGSDARGSGG